MSEEDTLDSDDALDAADEEFDDDDDDDGEEDSFTTRSGYDDSVDAEEFVDDDGDEELLSGDELDYEEEDDEPATVDNYIANLDREQAEVVSALRKLVLESAPNATEVVKWGQPVYEEEGPFCYIKAFNDHVNFGFWRGAMMADPEGILEGEGERMRHVRLSAPKDIRQNVLQSLVRQAVKLNRDYGDPTRDRRS